MSFAGDSWKAQATQGVLSHYARLQGRSQLLHQIVSDLCLMRYLAYHVGAGGEAPDLPFPVVSVVAAAFPLPADAAPPSVARYSSGGSLVLFSLRSYDPTTTKLSLSAGSQKGTVSMLRRRTL